MARKATTRKKGLDRRHRDLTGRLRTLLAETGTESLHAYLRKYHK
jgi:hypothetical protein